MVSAEPAGGHAGASRLPSVACRTATFGRPEPLNEAIEAFLRQDYSGLKTLHVLNDMPTMRYLYDHPEVEVINAEHRFATLGDKFNQLVEGAEADIIVNWPYDDIMLPRALSTVVRNISDNGVFLGRGYWYMENRHLGKRWTSTAQESSLSPRTSGASWADTRR